MTFEEFQAEVSAIVRSVNPSVSWSVYVEAESWGGRDPVPRYRVWTASALFGGEHGRSFIHGDPQIVLDELRGAARQASDEFRREVAEAMYAPTEGACA